MRNIFIIFISYSIFSGLSFYGQRNKLYKVGNGQNKLFEQQIKIDSMTTKQQNKEYAKRREIQLMNWVNGRPEHNKIDNECTPDFSCCNKSLLASSGERLIFLEAINKNNTISRDKMLFVFMERLAELKKMPAPIMMIKP